MEEIDDTTYKEDLKTAAEITNETPDVAVGLPPEFGTKEYTNNPDLDEERDAAEIEYETKHDEILKRRERIEEIKSEKPSTMYSELIKILSEEGFENLSMAQMSRDVQFIEEDAWKWADRQAQRGLVSECKEITLRFKQLIAKLTEDMESCNPRDIPNYAKQIHDLSMSIYYLKEQGGTFQALKQANSKYIKFMSSPEQQVKSAEFNR